MSPRLHICLRPRAHGLARSPAHILLLGACAATAWCGLSRQRQAGSTHQPEIVRLEEDGTPGPRPALAPPPPASTWKLAFVRDGDVWTANGDGSGARRVIRHGEAPCWSPDRRQLAFVRDGNVWLTRSDGTGERRLTDCPPADAGGNARPVDLSWDPVENRITFSHAASFELRRAGEREAQRLPFQVIFDTEPEAVGEAPGAGRFDMVGLPGLVDLDHPAWSRSGRLLAFTRDGDIWLSRRDEHLGDEPYTPWNFTTTRLAPVASASVTTCGGSSRYRYLATHLSWSPDEHALAYSLRRDGGTSDTNEVHLLQLSGGGGDLHVRDDRILADFLAWDPCFSPAGRSLAFVDGDAPFGSRSISVVALPGGRKRRLLANADQPAW